MIVLTNLDSIASIDDKLKNQSAHELFVLVFSTKTCGPCKLLKSKITSQLESKYRGRVCFVALGIEDNNDKLFDELNIKSVPTVIFGKFIRNPTGGVGTISKNEFCFNAENKHQGADSGKLCEKIDTLLQ
jgi:thiol-disulfide isomerase/thioredoxin